MDALPQDRRVDREGAAALERAPPRASAAGHHAQGHGARNHQRRGEHEGRRHRLGGPPQRHGELGLGGGAAHVLGPAAVVLLPRAPVRGVHGGWALGRPLWAPQELVRAAPLLLVVGPAPGPIPQPFVAVVVRRAVGGLRGLALAAVWRRGRRRLRWAGGGTRSRGRAGRRALGGRWHAWRTRESVLVPAGCGARRLLAARRLLGARAREALRLAAKSFLFLGPTRQPHADARLAVEVLVLVLVLLLGFPPVAAATLRVATILLLRVGPPHPPIVVAVLAVVLLRGRLHYIRVVAAAQTFGLATPLLLLCGPTQLPVVVAGLAIVCFRRGGPVHAAAVHRRATIFLLVVGPAGHPVLEAGIAVVHHRGSRALLDHLCGGADAGAATRRRVLGLVASLALVVAAPLLFGVRPTLLPVVQAILAVELVTGRRLLRWRWRWRRWRRWRRRRCRRCRSVQDVVPACGALQALLPELHAAVRLLGVAPATVVPAPAVHGVVAQRGCRRCGHARRLRALRAANVLIHAAELARVGGPLLVRVPLRAARTLLLNRPIVLPVGQPHLAAVRGRARLLRLVEGAALLPVLAAPLHLRVGVQDGFVSEAGVAIVRVARSGRLVVPRADALHVAAPVNLLHRPGDLPALQPVFAIVLVLWGGRAERQAPLALVLAAVGDPLVWVRPFPEAEASRAVDAILTSGGLVCGRARFSFEAAAPVDLLSVPLPVPILVLVVAVERLVDA
mmetsp:Transcript_16344/g.43671  ORF Transcript_16344/g.43671 Transcript_16344/m.43671 type:complete len:733 (+) Transcript_16344:368-2566(+)